MAKTILICAVYIFITLTGMTLIKSGYSCDPLFQVPAIGVGISLRTLAGILLYGVSFLIYTLFISRLKISIAMPIVSGLHCALTVVVGMLIFHENVSKGQIIGIALIVTGTILVGVLETTGKGS